MRAWALCLLVGCATATAPDRSCVLERQVVDRVGNIWTVRAFYSICPDTSANWPTVGTLNREGL